MNTGPAPLNVNVVATSPTRLDAAVRKTLQAGGMDPVTYRWVTCVESVGADASHTVALMNDSNVDDLEALHLAVMVAREIGARHGIEIAYRCICGANSPTPQCPDFPDCLPGGAS